jgi:photosystem II stability/assembly factor-like uncharacterized protein
MSSNDRQQDLGPGLALLVGTRKGLFTLWADDARRAWRLEGPEFLGHIMNHAVLDPRDRRTLLAASRTGHLGPTIFRSSDAGKSWAEASHPPAFPKGEGLGRVVEYTMCVVPGHTAEPDVWYAGTSPQGLFRSENAGDTWEPISGFNDHPSYTGWVGDEQDGTPGGPMLHSILIDPRDPGHLYVALSGGGVHESTDRGKDWTPLNAGMATVEPGTPPDFGPGHDPHCIQIHPAAPDVIYQQNHCGIYRLERPATHWERIGDNMPREVGDVGFPIGLHPRDPSTAWVFPMDGTDVWPRTSPDGRPAVYRTSDAGASWQRLDRGLPADKAWYTVLRQSLSVDAHDPVGVYFGTTSGEVWASTNEGDDWTCIARHLPQILAVEAAELGS